jgi:molecular chaperone GrpE
VAKKRSTIKDEKVMGFVREDEDRSQTDVESGDEDTEVETPTAEVIEGEIVAEEEEDALKEVAEATEEEEEEVNELTALRQQLEAAQAQADEYLDDLRRERAAFQNYKKRQENERAELRQLATSGLLMQILPIFDDLERALEAVPDDQSDLPWLEGITLIQRKLLTTMDNAGVVPVEAEPGQPFDPLVHEAVTYEENENQKEGEIIAVVQKGYKLNQRTLRPAMVRVAK